MATKTKAQDNGTTAVASESDEAKLHDWQMEFTIKSDMVERDIVALEKATATIPYLVIAGTNSYYEAYLCAAIEAGWIEAPEVRFEEVAVKGENGRKSTTKRYYYAGKDVAGMHPGAVRWLGVEVIGRYNEAISVPLAL